MQIQLTLQILALTLVLPVFAQAGCFGIQPGDKPFQLEILVDKSKSIPGNLSSWLKMVEPLAGCLRPGDSFRVLLINDDSGGTGPVIERTLPTIPPGASLKKRVAIKNEALKAKEEFKTALWDLFKTPGNTDSTDIFGLLERIRPAAGSKTIVVGFSDGLHASARDGINLETTLITPATTTTIFKKLVEKHAWTQDMLSGAALYIVLPTVTEKTRKTPPINDRTVLSQFYRTLITSLGGSLANFTVDLPGIP